MTRSDLCFRTEFSYGRKWIASERSVSRQLHSSERIWDVEAGSRNRDEETLNLRGTCRANRKWWLVKYLASEEVRNYYKLQMAMSWTWVSWKEQLEEWANEYNLGHVQLYIALYWSPEVTAGTVLYVPGVSQAFFCENSQGRHRPGWRLSCVTVQRAGVDVARWLK